MRLEIPVCRRCCFCLPLRRGILVFGYLNLAFSALLIAWESWLAAGDATIPTIALYRGTGLYVQMWFPIVLYSLEIIFNLVLVVGAHMKSISLLKVYYYYGITTTLAAFVTFVVVRNDDPRYNWESVIIGMGFAFSGLVIQGYLLLLVRSEIAKLRRLTGQLRFVNHVAEVTVDPPLWGDGRNPL